MTDTAMSGNNSCHIPGNCLIIKEDYCGSTILGTRPDNKRKNTAKIILCKNIYIIL